MQKDRRRRRRALRCGEEDGHGMQARAVQAADGQLQAVDGVMYSEYVSYIRASFKFP
jgi:hypothetical protein